MEREYPPRYVHEPSHPDPPLYEAHDHHELQDQAVIDPTIFILAGQSIHIKTLDSPPVYALSRSVAALSKATKQVEFERLDNVIRASSTQEATTVPVLKCRHRHLYDLRRTVKQPRIGLSRSRASSDAPEYYIHSMSRRTLGHVGLRKCSHGGFAAGFSAVPVRMDASQARFANEGKPLFMLQHHGDRSHWLSVEHGNIVAIEDAADDQKRLIIMKAMPRSEVDALVALWCCRIWQHAAAKAEAARREVEGSFILKKVALGQAVYRGRV